MEATLQDRIRQQIGEAPVVLFMKGTPVFPQCGFSAAVVQILSHLGVKFKGIDVLADPSVRQGIKEFSNWPTVPQLYVNGEFIGGCDISGAQAEALADGFAQLIAEQGGEVKKRENWGLRNLAYRMNKNRKGHYVLFNIDAPAAAIAELERTMRINEDVVRYLTLRVDTLDEAPSAIMQNRGSREDRPRRSDRDRYGEGRDGGERPGGEAPAPAIAPAENVEA